MTCSFLDSRLYQTRIKLSSLHTLIDIVPRQFSWSVATLAVMANHVLSQLPLSWVMEVQTIEWHLAQSKSPWLHCSFSSIFCTYMYAYVPIPKLDEPCRKGHVHSKSCSPECVSNGREDDDSFEKAVKNKNDLAEIRSAIEGKPELEQAVVKTQWTGSKLSTISSLWGSWGHSDCMPLQLHPHETFKYVVSPQEPLILATSVWAHTHISASRSATVSTCMLHNTFNEMNM